MTDEELKELINSAVPDWVPCIGAEAHGDPELGIYHGTPQDGGDYLLTVHCHRCGASGVAEICAKYSWFLQSAVINDADSMHCPLCLRPSKIKNLVKSIVVRKVP